MRRNQQSRDICMLYRGLQKLYSKLCFALVFYCPEYESDDSDILTILLKVMLLYLLPEIKEAAKIIFIF